MKKKTAQLKQKEELIEFLIYLSINKRFPLDVKDVDKYLEAKGMCELMCPEPEFKFVDWMEKYDNNQEEV